jgi:hypothetical protein
MTWTRSSATYGGSGGDPFADNLTEVNQIVGIVINADRYVDGFQIMYTKCGDETIYLGEWHGGTGGTSYTLTFQKGEILTAINGRADVYVDSLTFVTNVKSYTYGGSGGNPFSFPTSNVVGGFYGRGAGYIDAIGIFIPCS